MLHLHWQLMRMRVHCRKKILGEKKNHVISRYRTCDFLIGLSLICHFFLPILLFGNAQNFYLFCLKLCQCLIYFARNYASTCLPILLIKEKLLTKTEHCTVYKRCFYNSLSKRSVNQSLVFSEYYKPTLHAPIACLGLF